MVQIRKKTGLVQEFNANKIITSIIKSAERVHIDIPPTKTNKVIDLVLEKIRDCEVVDVRELHSLIVTALEEVDLSVAQSYCDYSTLSSDQKFSLSEESIEEQFVKNKIAFINKYKQSSNTANSTIDDNSNVSNKNVAILNAEIHKPENIRISRSMVMGKLKELYPDFNAKRYIRDLEDHVIYKHDESSFAGICPYCVSITMYPFLLNGIKGLGGLSASPKNLKSFCGIFCNMIFAISSQFAGAVAASETMLYFTYYCKKEWGSDFYLHSDKVVETTYEGKQRTILDEIHQYWQQIIYTINQPAAARGFQSAFVNFSYFDKPFFDGMFGDFCFPDGTQPDWESLKWIQMEFMKWFNAERLKTVLTFPVETVTLLYKDGKFLDEEMAQFVYDEYSRGHSFFTYISDTVDSLSSCCFDRDVRIMYSLKGSSSYEKCISIGEAYDKDHDKEIEVLGFNPYTNERKWVSGKFVKASSSNMYKITLNDRAVWTDVIATSDHILPILRDGEVKDITVADLRLSDKLLADKAQWYLDAEDYSDLEYVTIDSIVKINDKPTEVYCIELDDSTSPYFVLANGIITHNCRLKNKLQTKEFNFTLGNIGVQTGSKSVITFNLNRLVQLWYRKEMEKREDSFKFDSSCYPSLKKYLVKLMDRVYKYHHAYNELLWDMYDADLLPAYKAGFIHLNKQYLTLGINGLNQAAEFLGMECSVNDDYSKFCQEIFSLFKEQNELHKDTTSKHHLIFNTEQVPAESLGAKNYNWDKEDGYWVNEDSNLYASYIFKPNDSSLSVLDKIKMHGRDYIGEYLDGGSACHINLDSHLSSEQYKLLLNYAAENGCNYLTFNIPMTECKSCGKIVNAPIDKCPECGSDKMQYYTRIIGYLTAVKNWNSNRQKEFETRMFGDKGNYKTYKAK